MTHLVGPSVTPASTNAGPDPGVTSIYRCKFGAVQVPGLSLSGCDLLVDGVGVGLLVFDPVEVLAVDVGEGRTV